MRNLTLTITAYAQVLISIAFLCGYFALLYDFVHGHIAISPEWKEQVKTLLDILTAGILLILNYWFSRHRASGIT